MIYGIIAGYVAIGAFLLGAAYHKEFRRGQRIPFWSGTVAALLFWPVAIVLALGALVGERLA